MVASLPEWETTVIFARAILEIEDGICGISLRKERFLGRQMHDSLTQSSMGEDCGRIKCRLFGLNHSNAVLPDTGGTR